MIQGDILLSVLDIYVTNAKPALVLLEYNNNISAVIDFLCTRYALQKVNYKDVSIVEFLTKNNVACIYNFPEVDSIINLVKTLNLCRELLLKSTKLFFVVPSKLINELKSHVLDFCDYIGILVSSEDINLCEI